MAMAGRGRIANVVACQFESYDQPVSQPGSPIPATTQTTRFVLEMSLNTSPYV